MMDTSAQAQASAGADDDDDDDDVPELEEDFEAASKS